MKYAIWGLMGLVLLAGQAFAVQLTPEQQTALTSLGAEFAQAEEKLEEKLEAKLAELEAELTREGRLDSQEAMTTSVKTVNAMVKEVGKFYGQAVKSKVEFLIKAKDVLTVEQKLHLLEQLRPDEIWNKEEIKFVETEIPRLPLDLKISQRRKLIELEALAQNDELRAERDAKLILLDVEVAMMGDPIDPAKVNKLVLKLADLAAKVIDFRVDYFLKAKDILTLEQKQRLGVLLELD